MNEGHDDRKARLEQSQKENDDLRDKLQRAESCLDQLQSLFDVGYWTHDLVTGEIRWSDHAFRILEMERRPRLQQPALCDLGQCGDALARAGSGGSRER